MLAHLRPTPTMLQLHMYSCNNFAHKQDTPNKRGYIASINSDPKKKIHNNEDNAILSSFLMTARGP